MRTQVQAVFAIASAALLAVTTVQAGGVYEVQEAYTNVTASDFKFMFYTLPGITNGKVEFSDMSGAGKKFASSILPLIRNTMNKCTAIAPHHHPNAAETLYTLKGKQRVVQYLQSGEVITVDVAEGEAAYIEQGAVHININIFDGPTEFIQFFDYPAIQDTIFEADALVALPRNIVNSAFTKDVLYGDVMSAGPLVAVRGCEF